eukprot:2762415-Prymnesium_polylepis.1
MSSACCASMGSPSCESSRSPIGRATCLQTAAPALRMVSSSRSCSERSLATSSSCSRTLGARSVWAALPSLPGSIRPTVSGSGFCVSPSELADEGLIGAIGSLLGSILLPEHVTEVTAAALRSAPWCPTSLMALIEATSAETSGAAPAIFEDTSALLMESEDGRMVRCMSSSFLEAIPEPSLASVSSCPKRHSTARQCAFLCVASCRSHLPVRSVWPSTQSVMATEINAPSGTKTLCSGGVFPRRPASRVSRNRAVGGDKTFATMPLKATVSERAADEAKAADGSADRGADVALVCMDGAGCASSLSVTSSTITQSSASQWAFALSCRLHVPVSRVRPTSQSRTPPTENAVAGTYTLASGGA